MKKIYNLRAKINKQINPITIGGGGHKVPAAQIIYCSVVSSKDPKLKLGDFSSNLIC